MNTLTPGLLAGMLNLSRSGATRAIQRGDRKVLAIRVAWAIMNEEQQGAWLLAMLIEPPRPRGRPKKISAA